MALNSQKWLFVTSKHAQTSPVNLFHRYVTGNSATQGIALFPENISGNSATRCYILDNYSIITERRYIKICNNTYFFNEEHFSPNFISVRRTVPEIFSGNSAIPWVAPFPATYVHIFCILNNYSSGINVPYFWRAKISSDCSSIND